MTIHEPGMYMSDHAKTRCAQRAVDKEMLLTLTVYGEPIKQHNGRFRTFIRRADLQTIVDETGAPRDLIEKASRSVLINTPRVVVTVLRGEARGIRDRTHPRRAAALRARRRRTGR